MRGGKVDWDPDALMQDMGYGAPAPPPAPAAPAPAPPAKKMEAGGSAGFRRRRQRRRRSAGAGAGAGALSPSRGSTPYSRCWTAAPRKNPNGARGGGGGEAPSGDYYLSPTQEQSKEQFEEMQRRRDE